MLFRTRTEQNWTKLGQNIEVVLVIPEFNAELNLESREVGSGVKL